MEYTIRDVTDCPIGIFDSGVGGLAVLKTLSRLLPREDFLYVADTAHAPFGEKSAADILAYTTAVVSFLARQNVKFIVLACNTASAVALDTLQTTPSIPLVGTIRPSAEAAVRATRRGVIGVLATRRTKATEAYARAIHALRPDVRVQTIACPLLVSLVEEGRRDDPALLPMIEKAVVPLLRGKNAADILILGCTHFSFLRRTFERVVSARAPRAVMIVDSSEATAHAAVETLEAAALCRTGHARGTIQYAVTDDTRFVNVAQSLLGRPLTNVAHIHLPGVSPRGT